MKRILEVVGWLTAVILLAFASHAVFARPASPQGTPDAHQEQQNRGRRAALKEDINPALVMREARTIYGPPDRTR